jgi:hypothetical protein
MTGVGRPSLGGNAPWRAYGRLCRPERAASSMPILSMPASARGGWGFHRCQSRTGGLDSERLRDRLVRDAGRRGDLWN